MNYFQTSFHKRCCFAVKKNGACANTECGGGSGDDDKWATTAGGADEQFPAHDTGPQWPANCCTRHTVECSNCNTGIKLDI